MSARSKRVLLAGFSLLVSLLAAEVALRLWDASQGRGFWTTQGNPLAETPRSVIPFRTFGFDPYTGEGAGRTILSRWGERFPFRKAPGTLRIVCIGGSTTEDRIDGVHYPLLLEEMLRERLGRRDVEVINAGNSAYATPHALILLALDVVSWQPDLVVLSENVNDLSVAYWPGFRPDYWNKYRSTYYSVPDHELRAGLMNRVFQHSRLYWFLSIRMKMGMHRPGQVRRRSLGMEPLPEAVEVFRRNLKTFVEMARARKIDVMLGTQALEPSEEFFLRHVAYKPYNHLVEYPLQPEFVAHHRAFNAAIAQVAREEGVPLVDNAARLGGERRWFRDYVHHSPEGLREVARCWADAIVARLKR